MFCFLGSFFAEPVIEHSGLSLSQNFTKGFTMWCGTRGIKATTNICSVKQHVRPSRCRRNAEDEQIKQFILLQVSFLRLFPCWIITCVLLIFKDVVNFSLPLLPNSQLHAKPAAEVSPRGDESASERIYFIQISLFKCSEPLERSQGTWWKGNGEYRFNLWPSAKMPIRNASVSAGDRATAHCQLGINLRHEFD